MFYSLALQTITRNVAISVALVFNIEVLLLIDHQTVYLICSFYIYIYIYIWYLIDNVFIREINAKEHTHCYLVFLVG